MSGIGRPQFSLVDHSGTAVSEVSYPGKFLLVYFGFTHCKVVCPRSLGRLTSVLRSLPEGREQKLQPLYITVDPERDDPVTMKTYLAENFPSFTGLTGTPEDIDAAKKSFRVFAKKKPNPSDPSDYDVPHSAITYLIDPDGNYKTHWVDTKTEDDISADILALLNA